MKCVATLGSRFLRGITRREHSRSRRRYINGHKSPMTEILLANNVKGCKKSVKAHEYCKEYTTTPVNKSTLRRVDVDLGGMIFSMIGC